jgi:Uma2 family endonuclease
MAIPKAERTSEESYRRLALSDSQGRLELYRGVVREKPGMSVVHGDTQSYLVVMLQNQLDRRAYRLRAGHAHLRCSADTYYVPDIVVIPTAMEQALRARPNALDAYADPLPLVVEIWSPSPGDYDVCEKQPDYQRRGDREIWYIHPYHRTLTAWRRTDNGDDVVTAYRGGVVPVELLPDVSIDLEALFEP